MDAKAINQKALECLSNQDLEGAQYFFFKNAKENPSHQTFNNLGNFLIHEGLTYKNGRTRNAQKLGMNYLQRAASLEHSSVNFCAIAKAYDFAMQRATAANKTDILNQIYHQLIVAYSITPSPETKYNILRLQVLSNIYDKTIVEDIKSLITEFLCEESVRLYFETLQLYSLYDEGMHCISQYGTYLTEDDLLLFYAKHRKYREGFRLCDTVCKEYSPNKYTSSAIIECCVNTNHFEVAHTYAQQIIEIERSISYPGKKDMWINQVFSNLDTSDENREQLIAEYMALPPFLDTCCYFGCSIHNTAMWE